MSSGHGKRVSGRSDGKILPFFPPHPVRNMNDRDNSTHSLRMEWQCTHTQLYGASSHVSLGHGFRRHQNERIRPKMKWNWNVVIIVALKLLSIYKIMQCYAILILTMRWMRWNLRSYLDRDFGRITFFHVSQMLVIKNWTVSLTF